MENDHFGFIGSGFNCYIISGIADAQLTAAAQKIVTGQIIDRVAACRSAAENDLDKFIFGKIIEFKLKFARISARKQQFRARDDIFAPSGTAIVAAALFFAESILGRLIDIFVHPVRPDTQIFGHFIGFYRNIHRVLLRTVDQRQHNFVTDSTLNSVALKFGTRVIFPVRSVLQVIDRTFAQLVVGGNVRYLLITQKVDRGNKSIGKHARDVIHLGVPVKQIHPCAGAAVDKSRHRHCHTAELAPERWSKLVPRFNIIQLVVGVAATVAEHKHIFFLPQFVHTHPEIRPMIVAHKVIALPVDQTDGLGFVQINEIKFECIDQTTEVIEHKRCSGGTVHHHRVIDLVTAGEKVLCLLIAVLKHEKFRMIFDYIRVTQRRVHPVVYTQAE